MRLNVNNKPGHTRTLVPVKAVALAAFVLLFGGSALAQGDVQYPNWTARAWAGVVGRFVESDNVTFQDPTFGTVQLSWQGTSFGLGADVEYRFNKLFGLDLAAGYTNVDIEFEHSVGSGVQTDNLGILPIWLAANFHYVKQRFDLYAGPQIAYVIYLNNLEYNVPGVGTYNFETKNEFPALGFAFGADIFLKNDWFLNFAFRFVDADADEAHNLPLDPTFITMGVARRF